MNAEIPGAILVKIDLIKNGALWQTISPMAPIYAATLSDPDVTADGYYRVEVTARDMSDGSYYFAWSNPVFVSLP